MKVFLPNGNVTSKTEIFRLEDLVGAGVVEDSLGVDTSLVREGTVTAVKMSKVNFWFMTS